MIQLNDLAPQLQSDMHLQTCPGNFRNTFVM